MLYYSIAAIAKISRYTGFEPSEDLVVYRVTPEKISLWLEVRTF